MTKTPKAFNITLTTAIWRDSRATMKEPESTPLKANPLNYIITAGDGTRTGDGYGTGYGTGDGDGYGAGYGYGYGDGCGDGCGAGYRDGVE
jgi:hypothetical protein